MTEDEPDGGSGESVAKGGTQEKMTGQCREADLEEITADNELNAPEWLGALPQRRRQLFEFVEEIAVNH